MKKLIGICLTALLLLSPALAAGASTAHAQLWSGVVTVDGVKSDFADGQGNWIVPLSYNGTVYIPLRTAGDWMGAKVEWDQKAQTVLLTTGGEPRVYFNYDGPETTPEEFAQYEKWEAEGVDVTLRPDLTVRVDGAVQAFTNAKGEPVYPVVFRDTTYLPVRSIGELCGKQVLWVGKTEANRRERVVLYEPVTPAQRQEAETYVAQERKLLDRLAKDVDALLAAGKASDEQGLTLLRAVQATLKDLEAVAAPTAPTFAQMAAEAHDSAKRTRQAGVEGFMGDLTGKTRTFAQLVEDGEMELELTMGVKSLESHWNQMVDWLALLGN